MRFLGIDVEDALAPAENTAIWPVGSSPPARGRFTALGTFLPLSIRMAHDSSRREQTVCLSLGVPPN